jgi:hypothetical protein
MQVPYNVKLHIYSISTNVGYVMSWWTMVTRFLDKRCIHSTCIDAEITLIRATEWGWNIKGTYKKEVCKC